MPIYEYTCDDCGAEFEELVRSYEDTPNCPVCGSESISKKVSAFASSGSNSALNYSAPAPSCGVGGFS